MVVAEDGSSAASSAESGKFSRLRCVHPRRRTSASYARAAASLEAKFPMAYVRAPIPPGPSARSRDRGS